MLEKNELEWLADERPAPMHMDATTTARVREQLLAHAGRAGKRSRRSRRGARPTVVRRSALRIAVSGAVLGAVATAALLALSGGSGTHPGTGLEGLAASPAAAARLTHLSARLQAAAPPVGDATLVVRRQTYPNSPEIDGADLYADDGDYYYSPTLAGLPAVVAAGETVNEGAADSEVRDISAARSALTGPIGTARQSMSVASLDPGTKPSTITPAQAAAKMPAPLRQAMRQKLAEVQRNAAAQDIHAVISHENGMIWDNSMDALLAGAGDPQVRAGVLYLLATIPQVSVTQGTLDGQSTLTLTATLMTSKAGTYKENLVINASTGMPIEFFGGNAGQTPSVTVYYTITRVTVAAVGSGDTSPATASPATTTAATSTTGTTTAMTTTGADTTATGTTTDATTTSAS